MCSAGTCAYPCAYVCKQWRLQTWRLIKKWLDWAILAEPRSRRYSLSSHERSEALHLYLEHRKADCHPCAQAWGDISIDVFRLILLKLDTQSHWSVRHVSRHWASAFKHTVCQQHTVKAAPSRLDSKIRTLCSWTDEGRFHNCLITFQLSEPVLLNKLVALLDAMHTQVLFALAMLCKVLSCQLFPNQKSRFAAGLATDKL